MKRQATQHPRQRCCIHRCAHCCGQALLLLLLLLQHPLVLLVLLVPLLHLLLLNNTVLLCGVSAFNVNAPPPRRRGEQTRKPLHCSVERWCIVP